jgi:serine/threonine protein kinase
MARLLNAKPDVYAEMKIGRYEILDEVGQGAMGTVYRARDPLIERTVAIKTVSIAHLQQEGADAESRFLREAQSAGRLSHPNIVTIYDVGEANGLAYIAMEYLSGTTLRDIMNRGAMPFDLALDTTMQMAEALAFAHEHGVIHRDIKPANVIVTGQRGYIKLTDFGIAHLTNSGHTLAGQMLGSPRYMSPEQAMGKEVDGRSDIFSLGAVLYEMLTGHYAFDGDSLPAIVYRVVNETPVAATSQRPNLPNELVNLLASMLHKNPAARPDARALVNALHALAPAKPPVPAPPSSNRIPRLLPALAFGTPIGVFLLIGLGIIVIEHFLDIPRQPELVPTLPSAGTQQETVSPTDTGAPTVNQPATVPTRTVPPAPSPDKTDAYLEGLDKKQVELRIKRTELLLQYTDQYPDVVQIDRQLEQLNIERRRHLRRLQKNQKN